jgi:hypothetical protein
MLVKRDTRKTTTPDSSDPVLTERPTIEQIQSELHQTEEEVAALPPKVQSYTVGTEDEDGDDERPFAQRAKESGTIRERKPPKGSAAELAQIYGFDIKQLELSDPNLVSVPAPPEHIVRKLAAQEKGWRWMSKGVLKSHGNRGYTAYEMDDEDKKALQHGDGGGTFQVNVDNTLRWREDGILFVAPLRWIRLRELQRRLRVERQNVAANVESHERVSELAKRARGKFGANVQTWEQRGE